VPVKIKKEIMGKLLVTAPRIIKILFQNNLSNLMPLLFDSTFIKIRSVLDYQCFHGSPLSNFCLFDTFLQVNDLNP